MPPTGGSVGEWSESPWLRTGNGGALFLVLRSGYGETVRGVWPCGGLGEWDPGIWLLAGNPEGGPTVMRRGGLLWRRMSQW